MYASRAQLHIQQAGSSIHSLGHIFLVCKSYFLLKVSKVNICASETQLLSHISFNNFIFLFAFINELISLKGTIICPNHVVTNAIGYLESISSGLTSNTSAIFFISFVSHKKIGLGCSKKIFLDSWLILT